MVFVRKCAISSSNTYCGHGAWKHWLEVCEIFIVDSYLTTTSVTFSFLLIIFWESSEFIIKFASGKVNVS